MTCRIRSRRWVGMRRWGELASLRRCDIDTAARTIRVERSLTELPGGGYLHGPPKSEAGRRRVVFPVHITADLEAHLAKFASPKADALVFTTPAGTPLRHSNFRRRIWLPALDRAGIAELHFHDLRHTGNGLTAAAGATLREMMDRMGHSSTRAALIYMHGSDARQREIADSLSKLAESELADGRKRAKNAPRREASGT